MKQNKGSPMTFYTMGVACFFLAGFFMLVAFGAGTYRNTVEGQLENNRTRVLLSYISTCAKSAGGMGIVNINGTEDSQVLEIVDGDTGYCFRIYCYEGWLMEEYADVEDELDPALAQAIEKTENFQVEKLSDRMFAVTTDAGRILFSAGGGTYSAEGQR